MKFIKHGEESKKKIYRALCVLQESASIEVMQKLNIPDGFTIDQLTPLRVLHRRPLLKRPRRIYSVKARVAKGKYILHSYDAYINSILSQKIKK